LKGHIQKEIEFDQTSIDAAHERIQQEFAKNRKIIKTDNQERYTQERRKQQTCSRKVHKSTKVVQSIQE
jgi:hypothetical protein